MQATETFDEAQRCLKDATVAAALDQPSALAPLLKGRLALRPHTVDLAADAALRDATYDNLLHGWTPSTLMTFAQRRLDAEGVEYVRDGLAATTSCSYSTAWLYDLRRVRASVWWGVGRPHLTQWMQRHALNRADGLRIAVRALALVTYLPRTDEPHVATPRPVPAEVPAGTLVADARTLARIEALLARAAGSDHTEEAAACARKAQELMVRYAAVPVDDLFGRNPIAVARRLLARLRSGEPLADIVRSAGELTGRTA